jgi:hypothetical protein
MQVPPVQPVRLAQKGFRPDATATQHHQHHRDAWKTYLRYSIKEVAVSRRIEQAKLFHLRIVLGPHVCRVM